MQSIPPFDHEARHSQQVAGDVEAPTENTPLLRGIAEDMRVTSIDITTKVTVGVLLTIMLSGIVIGTYLLVEQGREENVLPPVEMAMKLVSRPQWEHTNNNSDLLLTSPMAPTKASHVIVLPTDTNTCWTAHACAKMLRALEKEENLSFPYNFLVSSSGHTFEGLGWRRLSPLSNVYTKPSLVLGFIGNFSKDPPVAAQMNEAVRFFEESISRQYLDSHFTIIGMTGKYPAEMLFQALHSLPRYDAHITENLT